MGVRQDLEQMIVDIKSERGNLNNIHITRFGGAFVAIENERIIKVGKVYVDDCPLVRMLYGQGNVADLLEPAITSVISNFGYFTDRREIKRNKVSIPYGASEMTMYAMRKGAIDTAVLVCDGAGTVVAPTADLVQGVGARINGIFYTSPIENTITQLQEQGAIVIDPESTAIDQLGGVETAAKKGYKNIAVTVSGADCDRLKEMSDIGTRYGVNIVKLIVCTTGISKEETGYVKKYGDIVWACASRPVREKIGPESILQISLKIPVFVLSENGLDFVAKYSKDMSWREMLSPSKRYYTTSKEREGYLTKITFGPAFNIFLYETGKLPIRTNDEPRPLI